MSPNTAWSIDSCIELVARTIFSPFFCAIIPPTVAVKVKELSHPGVYWPSIWVGILSSICELLFPDRFDRTLHVEAQRNKQVELVALLTYVNRLYAAAGSWLFLPPKLDWEKQVVLITGGGSGIGALLAETLSRRNVTVVILTIEAPRAPMENGVRSGGSGDLMRTDKVHTFICDVSNYAQVEECARQIRKQVGHPTIIVNNAGVVKGKLLLDLTEDDIRDTFGANTLAHFWILKAFMPEMLKRGKGHIVTVSSLLGLVGAAQSTDYCASKAALVNLHQSLRFELDNRYKTPRIRTTLVLPSFVHTSLFSHIRLPSATSSLFAFLCPELHPQQIVDAIIEALDSDEGRVIRLPFYTNLARIWPVGVGVAPKWMVDLFQWGAGADWAMREYGPRPDAAERLAAAKRELDGYSSK